LFELIQITNLRGYGHQQMSALAGGNQRQFWKNQTW